MAQIIKKNGITHVVEVEPAEERLRKIGFDVSLEKIIENMGEKDIFYVTDMMENVKTNEMSLEYGYPSYAWLYIGLSYKNEALFLSLVWNSEQELYCGYFIGTASFLVENMKKTLVYNRKEVETLNQNLQKFKRKYMPQMIENREEENILEVVAVTKSIHVEDDAEPIKDTEVGNALKMENVQFPTELTPVTEDIFYNLSYPNWNSINGLDRYIKIIGRRIEQLIVKNRKEYFVMNKISSVVVNTGLMDKFGNDYLVLYRYHEKNKAYMAYQIMNAKMDYINNDFTKEQASVEIKPISFTEDKKMYLEASIDDFDINYRCLNHIIEERRNRFPESLQEESADKIAEKLLVCLERGLKIQQRDFSYAKLTYSGESGLVSWLLPFHVNNAFMSEPELVMVIRQNGEFYEVKTVLPYDDEIKDRITALSLYRGLW